MLCIVTAFAECGDLSVKLTEFRGTGVPESLVGRCPH